MTNLLYNSPQNTSILSESVYIVFLPLQLHHALAYGNNLSTPHF